MRILTTGLAAAALLLSTTALTAPAYATNTCNHGCNEYPPPQQGGGDVDIDNTNHNTAIVYSSNQEMCWDDIRFAARPDGAL